MAPCVKHYAHEQREPRSADGQERRRPGHTSKERQPPTSTHEREDAPGEWHQESWHVTGGKTVRKRKGGDFERAFGGGD